MRKSVRRGRREKLVASTPLDSGDKPHGPYRWTIAEKLVARQLKERPRQVDAQEHRR